MILSRAPMRISLGGGGTDLASYYEYHGGFILSAAIDKYIYIYANRPSADDLIRVKYSRYEEAGSPSEVQHDLVRPTLELLNISSNIEIASMADVPGGTGLGSSGTYLVALLAALYELKRDRVPTQVLAEMACHIELTLAGHAVGKHDHYMAAFGGITCLEIGKDGRVHVYPLAISMATAEELRNRTMLFFTGVTRASDSILTQQRNDTKNGVATVVESLHETKQIGLQIKDSLEKGDLDTVGLLMHDHWEAKKRRSSLISNMEIDRAYAQARRAGALGGKLIGAGGGGFLMLHAPSDSKRSVRRVMASAGLREMPYQFDFEGAKVMVNV